MTTTGRRVRHDWADALAVAAFSGGVSVLSVVVLHAVLTTMGHG